MGIPSRKRYVISFIIVSSMAITYLHYSTIPKIHDLHNIFTELYYLPLILAALVFGMRGAVVTFLLLSFLYIPYVIINWTSEFTFVANKFLHAVFSGTIAILAGYLVDREKRHRLHLEKDRYLAGLGQAAAAIVHDLKNPLITVLGYARRINQGKGDIRAASQTVIDAGEKMEKIVHDVLDFAKPVRLEFQREDMSAVLRSACDICRTRAEEKGVVLSLALPAAPVHLSIDRSHMERALVNLVSNAVDASAEGKSVDIELEAHKDRSVVTVRDRGVGMDRETIENIFIPFFTQKRSGTGLGMAIVKKIIEAHGGMVKIESRLTLGTVVRITLQGFINRGRN